MRQQDVHEELRARLHEAAEAHEPDRARILARVERGMAASPTGHRAVRPPALGWFRVAGATAAVAGVLAVGGYAVASAVKDEPPARQTVAVSPTPTGPPDRTEAPAPPVRSADPTPGKGAGEPSRTPDASPSRTPGATAPAEPPAARAEQDGPLWSDGSVDPHSNDFWAQSNLTLKTSEPLSSLTVALKVAQTGGGHVDGRVALAARAGLHAERQGEGRVRRLHLDAEGGAYGAGRAVGVRGAVRPCARRARRGGRQLCHDRCDRGAYLCGDGEFRRARQLGRRLVGPRPGPPASRARRAVPVSEKQPARAGA